MIHDIVYHGGGGFDWPTVYAMPIWLRNYTYSEIVSAKNAESEALKNTGKGKGDIDINNPDKSNIPKEAYNIKHPQSKPTSPNYITKASKK
tara:strand:- start:471 stop:743 length:273 start_codon:yes stop_codon:yes gene_type:complete